MGVMNVTRRQFFRYTGTAVGASTLSALGFSSDAAVAAVRPFKLAQAKETRNTCPYCSVSCGIIMYSRANPASGKSEIFHIEGDADHPVNRGTLCPKGSALLDFVNSKTRTQYPQYRGPGEKAFRRVTWDFALDRITKLMKEDRDKNFIEKNQAGTTVNRWTTTGFLAASATSNETAFVTYKMVRSSGMVVFDNQARV